MIMKSNTTMADTTVGGEPNWKSNRTELNPAEPNPTEANTRRRQNIINDETFICLPQLLFFLPLPRELKAVDKFVRYISYGDYMFLPFHNTWCPSVMFGPGDR